MTHFNWALDGSIVGFYLLLTMIAGIMVRKYVGKVEHFLVAGREMNIYLGIASLAATEFGIVTCMYAAQAGYTKGFSGAVPGICNAIAMFIVGWTGFCIKPLRDSGVMTIPEIFEQRFGKNVRWLAGVVIVLGGLLNMGVFLRVGGQFLVVCCGLDIHNLEIAMTVLLVMVAVYTILGGMLSVLVTDSLQFVAMSVGLILVTGLILHKVGWTSLVSTVNTHLGPGGTNPFDKSAGGMGWSYVVSNLITNTAAVLTWQTVIARLLAAKDSKTGRKVYTGTAFFFVCRWIIPGIWGIAALGAVSAPILQSTAAGMGEAGSGSLFAMPYYLSQIVPAGIMGILVAAMLAADMSTDSSYMLTWGSVIYNDIMAPFRKKQWTEKRGLLWNRFIVAGIGIFLLIWGLWYKLEGNLWEYLQTTGTVYLSSMSILLISCCYWKRANNWGAIAAIILGAALPVAGLSLNTFKKIPAISEDKTSIEVVVKSGVIDKQVVLPLPKATKDAKDEGIPIFDASEKPGSFAVSYYDASGTPTGSDVVFKPAGSKVEVPKGAPIMNEVGNIVLSVPLDGQGKFMAAPVNGKELGQPVAIDSATLGTDDTKVGVLITPANGQPVALEGVVTKKGWASTVITDHFINIGTYIIVALAMVIGSLIKPKSKEAAA